MMEFRELFEFSFPDLNTFDQSRLMTNSQLKDVIPVNLNLKLYVFNDELVHKFQSKSDDRLLKGVRTSRNSFS
jgi:hypothetical protein